MPTGFSMTSPENVLQTLHRSFAAKAQIEQQERWADMNMCDSATMHPQIGGLRGNRRKHRRAKKRNFPRGCDAAGAVNKTLTDEELQKHVALSAQNLLSILRLGRIPEALKRFDDMAFQDSASSRAAQQAFETATIPEQLSLAWALSGKVLSASQNKFANYVLQKIIEVMPLARIGFVVSELTGHGFETARHRIGCRIICRLLEHAMLTEESIAKLLDEVLVGVETLCTHDFGRHVVIHFLEHGLPCHCEHIFIAIRANLSRHTFHRKTSHIVEAALKRCASAHQQVLVDSLLADEKLLELASGQSSRHVMASLLRHESPDIQRQAFAALSPLAAQLGAVNSGKIVFRELSLMMDTKGLETCTSGPIAQPSPI
jgi:hypothetical protein